MRVIFFYRLDYVLTYLQGPLDEFPILDSINSPLSTYSLIYGILTNGLTDFAQNIDFEKIFSQFEPGPIHQINKQNLLKQAISLVDELTVIADQFDLLNHSKLVNLHILPLIEWRKKHSNVFPQDDLASFEKDHDSKQF